ncbi:hypothetical protein SNE40_002626 [Patella caerulea]|uniref:B3/B4 tRNA-binding domain-containing protein n=1 Tax=Patella caerulea TaxID=87958 RepID=A0AAN8Q3D5_PATCE
MSFAWPEVSTARKEKRKELTLHGADINERIESGGLDEHIFKLNLLNYLDISKTCLPNLSESIGKLTELMRLSLGNNQLTTLPPTIGNLSKLKLLDLSNNKLESLPEELSQLTHLETLNLSVNKLTRIPLIGKLAALAIFDVSYNELTELPDGISENHEYLTQIRAGHNKLTELPEDLSNLVRLTTLDVSENKLKDLPLQLCECPKLKEFNGKGNCIGERRLAKMVDQGQFKVMMTYLSAELQKQKEREGKSDKKSKSKKKKKGKDKDDEEIDLAKNMISVLRFPLEDESGVTVSVQVPVVTVRPYIVCCIVRHLNLKKSLNMFKHFITLQTRLHDTVCQKRQAATIATHDMKFIKGPLTYTAEFPQLLKITPLFKFKEVSAQKLMRDLVEEAEALRKEKKRNTISGIHKYLELLKGKVQYPCLRDASDQVISFPPITNSDKTKISDETTDILIEVTSSTSLDVCKNVMEELLKETLLLGIGRPDNTPPSTEPKEADTSEGAGATKPEKLILVVEQVKIVDHEGALKVLYPSRTDLTCDAFQVIRNYD